MTARIRRRLNSARTAAMRAAHAELWRLVEGAVVDAMKSHPEYFTDAALATAVPSITKRVVGQLAGHANEARKRGRFDGAASCACQRAKPLQADPAAWLCRGHPGGGGADGVGASSALSMAMSTKGVS